MGRRLNDMLTRDSKAIIPLIYRGTASGKQTVYLDTPGSSTSYTYKGSSEHSGTPPSSGTRWVVKNLLELKNAERVQIEGNVLENVWKAGQAGYAIVSGFARRFGVRRLVRAERTAQPAEARRV